MRPPHFEEKPRKKEQDTTHVSRPPPQPPPRTRKAQPAIGPKTIALARKQATIAPALQSVRPFPLNISLCSTPDPEPFFLWVKCVQESHYEFQPLVRVFLKGPYHHDCKTFLNTPLLLPLPSNHGRLDQIRNHHANAVSRQLVVASVAVIA